jgi:hypothetical protein
MINHELLKKHLNNLKKKFSEDQEKVRLDHDERRERISYYQSWTKDRILEMSAEDFLAYLSRLWAMLIWGNKQYVVDKMIQDNGFDQLKNEIADLIWNKDPIEGRWEKARKAIKGMGPAMLSELLCHVHPDDYMIWNRRAFVGLDYLGVEDVPSRNYQVTGKKYKELCNVSKQIASEMESMGFEDTTLLAVDYFIWDELQVVDNLSAIRKKAKETPGKEELTKEESKFVHNDVRDALRDIGEWLGFKAEIEKKVADGSVVDTVWESKIGNMGRVMYVFEVQTKGSIDSLILNLLKAKNNPAVQGVVAVSDKNQLERIRKHAADVPGLGNVLKVWDYEEVLNVHDSLEFVNVSINKLNLVPEGF